MLTEEALYWIALHKAPGIGPKRFYRLLGGLWYGPGGVGSGAGRPHQSAWAESRRLIWSLSAGPVHHRPKGKGWKRPDVGFY